MSNVFLFLDLLLQILHGKKMWRTSRRWLFWAHMWMKISLSCTYAWLIACLGIEFQDGNNFPSTLKKILFISKKNFFWPQHAAYGNFIPQPGIEPGTKALKVPSPNNWNTKEFPPSAFKNISLGCKLIPKILNQQNDMMIIVKPTHRV